MKKKRGIPEDFIGWKSPDGKLEVIGLADQVANGGRKLFKVTCTECSKDSELFPAGYFIGHKGSLVRGQKPCGCSVYKWEDWQFLILARRAAKGRFIVHGFAEEFSGAITKLDLECMEDGYRWNTTVDKIVNSGRGCPKCAGNARPTEQEALEKCTSICQEMGYEVIGFPEGYKNSRSRFEYICKIHGKQEISYRDFVNYGNRCPSCAEYGYNPNKQGNFYVIKWSKNSRSFIKFGITNRDIGVRIEEQARHTEYMPELLIAETFEDGKIPKIIEYNIKNSGIDIEIVSRDEFPDGFTETTHTKNLALIRAYANLMQSSEVI